MGAFQLLEVFRSLSRCEHTSDVLAVLRDAAREYTAADGVTVVLKDEGNCYYVDESAIAPLWKGSRFPLDSCISGWCMINRQAVAIPDIYKDDRIPHDAYRPTFVRSLANGVVGAP